jgi:hypothetical protein
MTSTHLPTNATLFWGVAEQCGSLLTNITALLGDTCRDSRHEHIHSVAAIGS